MAKYLQEDECNYTVQEKQNHIKCRINDILSFNDLFNDETEEKYYTSRILCENMKISQAPM